MDPVEKSLRDARLDKNAIHEIVLVGGSTRIPKVRIRKFFENFEKIVFFYKFLVFGTPT